MAEGWPLTLACCLSFCPTVEGKWLSLPLLNGVGVQYRVGDSSGELKKEWSTTNVIGRRNITTVFQGKGKGRFGDTTRFETGITTKSFRLSSCWRWKTNRREQHKLCLQQHHSNTNTYTRWRGVDPCHYAWLSFEERPAVLCLQIGRVSMKRSHVREESYCSSVMRMRHVPSPPLRPLSCMVTRACCFALLNKTIRDIATSNTGLDKLR